MSSLVPKYSMARNPVYQVDFSAPATGKCIAATKRRVRFRFGFSSAEAAAKGLTGTECRGAEHEVTLVWSLISGKRLVMADGEEVHYSKGKRTETRFETSWTMQGGHVLKLIAHAAPPLTHTPGFRQFDLLLDGLSYFDMPRIYELGIGSKSAAKAASPAYNNYSISPREEPQWDYDAHAHEAHYAMDRAPSAHGFTQTRPATIPVERSMSMPSKMATDPAPAQDHLESPVSVMDNFSSAPAAYDEFAPVEPVVQSPSPAAVHSQILSAYEPSPAPTSPPMLALANQPHTYTPDMPVAESPMYSATPTTYTGHEQENTTPTTTHPSPVPLSMSAPLNLAEQEQQHMSEMERALKNLVNFEDIATPVKTPEQLKKEQLREQELKKQHKSHGLPPTAPSWQIGDKASLADIQAHAEPRAAPCKEVMRTHAFDPRAAQAGMMVVYGSRPDNGYGPPQLDAPGFGVPAQMAYRNAAYGYHQQQAFAAY